MKSSSFKTNTNTQAQHRKLIHFNQDELNTNEWKLNCHLIYSKQKFLISFHQFKTSSKHLELFQYIFRHYIKYKLGVIWLLEHIRLCNHCIYENMLISKNCISNRIYNCGSAANMCGGTNVQCYHGKCRKKTVNGLSIMQPMNRRKNMLIHLSNFPQMN